MSIDDIVWEKPDGAGGQRGKRFAADRNPLAYKPVPVTEFPDAVGKGL